MIYTHTLNESDIMSLNSIGKILKCDKIIYDSSYINPIIGIGAGNSYIQTIRGLEVNLYNNNFMVDVLTIKNLAKEPEVTNILSDLSYIEYMKTQIDICRSMTIDKFIKYHNPVFHEDKTYQDLTTIKDNAYSSGIIVGSDFIYIPKAAIPTNKSDKVAVTTYSNPESQYNILKLSISKPKGIVIDQYIKYLEIK